MYNTKKGRKAQTMAMVVHVIFFYNRIVNVAPPSGVSLTAIEP